MNAKQWYQRSTWGRENSKGRSLRSEAETGRTSELCDQPTVTTTRNASTKMAKPLSHSLCFSVAPDYSSRRLLLAPSSVYRFTLPLLHGARTGRLRRDLTSPSAGMILPDSPLASDMCATAVTGAVAVSIFRLWQETAKRGIFDQKMNRKLVHISIGLAFMLCWPLFSSENRGALLASLIPGINIIKMLLLGLGLYKDEAAVRSISRFGDHRELLRGPLYYAVAATVACIVYWRTSPISIAVICNMCAGDGFADIVGRKFGSQKIPYNKNKSFAGSVAMASAGFLASIGYMYYFSTFGFVQGSREMVLGFLVVSLASALVESLPISSELDDNLTVPLTSLLIGSCVF